MRDDRAYLERARHDLTAEGLHTEWRLGRGEPASVIVETAQKEHVDLVAMATHGHRLNQQICSRHHGKQGAPRCSKSRAATLEARPNRIRT